MNLVNELQVSAEQDDVLTVLRKTKRLASKLGRRDIDAWLQCELDGYPRDAEVPAYRIIRATLGMKTNGYVPIGYGYLMNGIQELADFGINPKMPVREPVSAILSMVVGEPNQRDLCIPIARGDELDLSVRRQVDPLFRDQVSFVLRLDDSRLRAIPEQIKNKVLDWACALEQAGVNGDGQSFTCEEKRIADSVTINISGSQIEQLNNMGANLKG